MMRVTAILALVGVCVVATAFAPPAPTAPPVPYRPFDPGSIWNTLAGSGTDSHNAKYIAWLKANAADGLKLAVGAWAMPVYWSQASDPIQTIDPSGLGPTVTFHEPANMQSMTGNDAALVVFDTFTDQNVALFEYNATTNTATGAARYYMSGNGIADAVDGISSGDDGHRGIPGSVHMVRRDEITAGVIDHRLKVSIPGTGECGVYPMDGYEQGKGGLICEGMTIRIKPTVNFTAKGITGACATVGTALQKYGAVIGDNGGGTKMSLKVEAADWRGTNITAGCLSSLTWDYFKFTPAGT